MIFTNGSGLVSYDPTQYKSALTTRPPNNRVRRLSGRRRRACALASVRRPNCTAYVGDGLNRWPAVHRLDAAHLFRFALEKGAEGARYHGVADRGVPVRNIADVIRRRLNVPVVVKSPEEAANHFGFLGYFVGADCPASSAQTQERLGWRPTQPGLVPDIDRPIFQSLKKSCTCGASAPQVLQVRCGTIPLISPVV
jgi:nucleoside-diphosphate-sugar epimerase